MKKTRGKENRKQRSLVTIAGDMSDSEEDYPDTVSPLKTKRSAVQRLPFSNSPGKRNVVMASQGKPRKYDPMHQSGIMMRCGMTSYGQNIRRTGWRRVSMSECGCITRPRIDGSLARDEDGGRR